MKRFQLLAFSMVLAALCGVMPTYGQSPRKISSREELIGTRIWNYVCVVTEDSVNDDGETVYYKVNNNPYYCGHAINIEAGENDNVVKIFLYVNGNTEYSVTGKVDVEAGTVSIPNEQRVDYATVNDTTTEGSGEKAITTVTNTYYDLYLYNVDDGESDIVLDIQDDGSMYFKNQFAIAGKIKSDVTQTSQGKSNTTAGEWQGPYYFDLNGYEFKSDTIIGTDAYILVPNGKHKMTSYDSGDSEVPIYMELNDARDSVFIVNLFDKGMRGNYMTYEQTEEGAMTFPCQMLYNRASDEYSDDVFNFTADDELTTIEGYGNEGLAYMDSLVWNNCLLYSLEEEYVFDFTTYNKIYFTDGQRFFGTVDVTIGDTGYGTLYYGDYNLKLPSGVTAYIIKSDGVDLEGGTLTYTALTGGIIPAGTAVVLKAESGKYTFDVTSDTGTDDVSSNLLKGTDTAATFSESGTTYFVLSLDKDGNNVGFYYYNKDGTSCTIPAHKAYLPLTSGTSVKGFRIVFDEADAIGGITADGAAPEGIYTATGVKLRSLDGQPAGLYIVNGKKVYIK